MAPRSGPPGGRVHAVVAAGKSAEEVRRAIDACAPPGDERRRAAAINISRVRKDNSETPLQAAHRLRRGDLIALLLEEGADASKVRTSDDGPTTALALCVCYDLHETLRALLRKGGHDADQRFSHAYRDLPAAADDGCTLAHVCVRPPLLSATAAPPPPRLACLEALVREGGASVDSPDQHSSTPLHWAARRTFVVGAAAVDLLVRLGADVNARANNGRTPVFRCVRSDLDRDNAAMLLRLLAHGASPDVVDDEGYTPLMMACCEGDYQIAIELVRRSSPATRCAVVPRHGPCHAGFSAADFIARARWFTPSQKEMIAELFAYGTPVMPQLAVNVLTIAVSHALPLAARKEAELSRRRAELCSSWRAHEAFSGLAMDVGELRAAESEAEAKRRRVLELEMELMALRCGAESSSSSCSDEGESDDDGSESGSDDEDESGSEEEEAGAAPSGGSRE